MLASCIFINTFIVAEHIFSNIRVFLCEYVLCPLNFNFAVVEVPDFITIQIKHKPYMVTINTKGFVQVQFYFGHCDNKIAENTVSICTFICSLTLLPIVKHE